MCIELIKRGANLDIRNKVCVHVHVHVRVHVRACLCMCVTQHISIPFATLQEERLPIECAPKGLKTILTRFVAEMDDDSSSAT